MELNKKEYFVLRGKSGI